jgi:hypothetical protein
VPKGSAERLLGYDTRPVRLPPLDQPRAATLWAASPVDDTCALRARRRQRAVMRAAHETGVSTARTAHALQVAVDPIDDLDSGGSFYQWQCEQHASAEPSGAYEEMVSSPEFERLRLLVHASVERYLGELEVALPEDAPLDLFIWATVLRADQDHPVHFHPSAVCSGSFYSQVPAGAGGLWLQDPRGTLPPFTQRLKFAPSNGDLVVFPSWLQHQVALGQSSGELRVSWSFNLETEAVSTWPWDCTSGVAVQHPYVGS